MNSPLEWLLSFQHAAEQRVLGAPIPSVRSKRWAGKDVFGFCSFPLDSKLVGGGAPCYKKPGLLLRAIPGHPMQGFILA